MVLEGYIAREENEWDRTRNIMAFLATFGGMGAKKVVQPSEVISLHKDMLDKIKPIRSYKEAMELLKTFQESM
jgi:hypothetical protein